MMKQTGENTALQVKQADIYTQLTAHISIWKCSLMINPVGGDAV